MKIQVIIGSTRQGRVSDKVAKWVATAAAEIDGFEVETVGLADYNLPFLVESVSPRYNPNRELSAEAQAWLNKIAEADGYIMVSPEYNAAMPGVLKNALDTLDHQLDRKPVALVTHGVVGGAEAAANLRLVLRRLGAGIVPEAVTLMGASELINESGQLDATAAANPYGPGAALTTMLDSLSWWTATLKAGRDKVAAA